MYHTKHIFPSYTRLEHFADACVHVAGLIFGVAATVFLLAAALRPPPAADIAGLIVYCIGLMGMFAASAAYNLVSHHEIKEILRRLDHSAIFVMIAGSYTPFAIVVGGAALAGSCLRQSGPSPLSAWASSFAFRGASTSLRSCFISSKARLAVLAIGPVAASLPSQALWLLVIGGIVYTAGVPFHLMEWMRFHNAIWHLFVLGGAACQFVAIKGAVIRAGTGPHCSKARVYESIVIRDHDARLDRNAPRNGAGTVPGQRYQAIFKANPALELHVDAPGEHIDRAAFGEVGGVADPLIIGGDGQVAGDGVGIIGLDDLFARVAWQPAISDQEAAAVIGQIGLEIVGDFINVETASFTGQQR